MSVYETQGFKLDNSGKRVVVDPVTRIEGHMRVEVNLDSNNVIRNAVSTGTMTASRFFLSIWITVPSGFENCCGVNDHA